MPVIVIVARAPTRIRTVPLARAAACVLPGFSQSAFALASEYPSAGPSSRR
ncbi:hypothetical protein SAMN05444165_0302 [Paraburkholderia phenazinium]|uniref:Uncharacterized protein n=1 Tax=Paraburkholderia phenazinium TaxID=60549 RepID=A0A1N6FNP5_9BURK|nr:hypothetical protein SAMN05444165_0302 [Paraburkholderia phenazinium]